MNLLKRLQLHRKLLHRLKHFGVGTGVGDEAAIQNDIRAVFDHVFDVLQRAPLVRAHVFFADGHRTEQLVANHDAGLDIHQRSAELRKAGAASARMQVFQIIQNKGCADLVRDR